MNEFDENKIKNEDENDDDSYITLTDDEGNDVHFEFLDLISYNGKDYAVLIPFEDFEDEVVILEVSETEDSDTAEYLSVDDDDLLNAVFELFKQRHADEFDFED